MKERSSFESYLSLNEVKGWLITMAVADEKEILDYLTSIMRREEEEVSFANSFKAAELLGKYYGMFEAKHDAGAGDVIIIDNINGKRRKKA